MNRKCDFGQQEGDSGMRPKRSKMPQELQLLLATAFNEILQVIEESCSEVDVPTDLVRPSEKLSAMVEIVRQLSTVSPKKTTTEQISCKDCLRYEQSLQKLEKKIREHIRLEQQLQIFQESIEEKAEESRREKLQFDKKLDCQKKQIEDLKAANAGLSQKCGRLESEGVALKAEVKYLKGEAPSTRRDKQSGYQTKENKIDWIHRPLSVKPERKSIEKRGDSGEKSRVSATNRSTKIMSVMTDKLIMDRNKEEKKKAIQSKFEYRR